MMKMSQKIRKLKMRILTKKSNAVTITKKMRRKVRVLRSTKGLIWHIQLRKWTEGSGRSLHLTKNQRVRLRYNLRVRFKSIILVVRK